MAVKTPAQVKAAADAAALAAAALTKDTPPADSTTEAAADTAPGQQDATVTDVAVKGENAVAVAAEPKPAYITALLAKIKSEFVKVNAGIDLDYVYMGDRLVTDKKGNFVEADDDTVKYGDSIDVVVGAGQKLFSLWGKQDSPENGTLIVAEPTQEDAEAVFAEWVEANPEAADRYTIDDIQLRFVVYFIPVSTLAESEGLPTIYLMTFPKTATIAFGQYGMKVFKGKYKANGIPAYTGVNNVITRISTIDKKSKSDASISYIALEYEAVGPFVPADYGLSEDV